MDKKGFTLVELLVVIGILAILTAAVVVILNPAELLKQARDSQRFSDLDAVKNAIALYLADEGTSLTGNNANCYVYNSATSGSACGGRFANGSTQTSAAVTVAGSGWIPVAFSGITSGSPLSALPTDPSNSGAGSTYYYAYKGNNTDLTFEINAVLESTKYATDKSTNDGGSDTGVYEVGSDLSL